MECIIKCNEEFFSLFFICKSNSKLSHNGSSADVETNGININEDITMNSKFDRVWRTSTHRHKLTDNHSRIQ